MRPRCCVLPLEYSEGTRPTYAMKAGAVAKRRKSPISAARITAVSNCTPRSA